MTGGRAVAQPRHFWRETASTIEPMALVSLPLGRVTSGNWRSTQTDVDDMTDLRRVVGSDGSFIATTSELPNRLHLWTGLGASASMPTFVNAATLAIPYDFDVSLALVSFDLAWVADERYVLGLVLRDGASLFARLVPAQCNVDCAGDPEVCSTGCAFGVEVDLPLAGVTDGSWGWGAGFCRSAYRGRFKPNDGDYGLGFRVVRR